MLERRRQAKQYHIVPGDEDGLDVELGEGPGQSQDTDAVTASVPSLSTGTDDWEETAHDNWDEDGPADTELRISGTSDVAVEGNDNKATG